MTVLFSRSGRLGLWVVLGLVVLVAGGCARSNPGRVLFVSVHNDGDYAVRDVRVAHGGSNYQAIELLPEQRQKAEFAIIPDEKIRIEYEDSQGRLRQREYELHTLPEHGGDMQFRIDRYGELTVLSRYYYN